MGFEIDFLAVGKESKSGDAIALRYGDLNGPREKQRVVVIDGGYTDEGAALVDHIRRHYETDRVDVVLSTHPDQDHVCGLKVVLDTMNVGSLWMHLPWAHSQALKVSSQSLSKWSGYSETLQKSLAGSADLEATARSKGIPIVEPFAGLSIDSGQFTVLGPTQAFYELMLAEIKAESIGTSLLEAISKMYAGAKGFVDETIHRETLKDEGETSPQNNCSVISLLKVDGKFSLFTGDAGLPALEGPTATLEAMSFAPGRLNVIQVPHHGSRRNVGPTILNRLLGSKGEDSVRGHAFVSVAAQGEPKHPSKKVTNAFRRRGYPVYATQGKSVWEHHEAPPRADWTDAEALPLYERVEHDEDQK